VDDLDLLSPAGLHEMVKKIEKENGVSEENGIALLSGFQFLEERKTADLHVISFLIFSRTVVRGNNYNLLT
jgi:hypothetical protein